MKQIELARRLGVSRSAVNLWEMSLSCPSVANVVGMAKIFRVSTDYILSLSDDLSVNLSGLCDEERALVLRLVECLESKNSN